MGQDSPLSDQLPKISVGVLLPESASAGDPDEYQDEFDEPDEVDETGHIPAFGRRGRHAATRENRVAVLGQDILRAAAEAVGREVALVVSGVAAGIESRGSIGSDGALRTGSFVVDALELKFGVKATLGAGKAVEAFLTATGEATVEVTLALRQPGFAES